jgi:branched-chain amino acid transport system ATP-binding protein
MAEPLLEVRNIETYYGPIMALRGVSLEVPEGRIVTVLGANGAGKTTILKTISGVMEPRKGSITLAGKSIHKHEPDWVARQGIAHVPEGREIFPFLSVYENLMMGAYTRPDRGALAGDLDAVYGYFPILKERAQQPAAYLSGGQQQMLVIGRGLMARPKLMLLDEPSLGLSPLLVQEIFAIIRRLNEERKVTILLVEQNANMALKVAHHGYVLELGRIVMNDTCERLRESDDVKEFFLGMKEEGMRGRRRWKRKKTWR